MAHVTFIHGIGQKPAADALLGIWRRALTRRLGPPGSGGAAAADDAIDLGAEGVSTSLVYWADALYPAPDPDVAAHESANEREALATDLGAPGEAITLDRATDADWLARLTARLVLQDPAVLQAPEAEAPEAAAEPPRAEERFPLPWALKQRFLAAFLRDVHHYLFDVEWAPRPDETYRVQQEIRRRFVEALEAGAARGGPHVVVSHSMGTVIAYDCLKRVPDCPPVDALITLGSPLGIDEVQDKLQPGWTRRDGFSRTKVRGEWVNIFDRLDVVAALDPELANDFREGGEPRVRDIHEPNYGSWRHSLRKYFEGPQLRSELRRLLDL
jgi:alpha/beta hydrolase family protein